MTADPNQCLEQLKVILEDALVDVYADAIFDYRVVPTQLNRTVSLSRLRIGPGTSTTGGFGDYYDIVAMLLVKHEKNKETLRAAERTLNSLEVALRNALKDTRNTLWMKVVFAEPSQTPLPPPGVTNARYGEVYFRLKLR